MNWVLAASIFISGISIGFNIAGFIHDRVRRSIE